MERGGSDPHETRGRILGAQEAKLPQQRCQPNEMTRKRGAECPLGPKVPYSNFNTIYKLKVVSIQPPCWTSCPWMVEGDGEAVPWGRCPERGNLGGGIVFFLFEAIFTFTRFPDMFSEGITSRHFPRVNHVMLRCVVQYILRLCICYQSPPLSCGHIQTMSILKKEKKNW